MNPKLFGFRILRFFARFKSGYDTFTQILRVWFHMASLTRFRRKSKWNSL